MLSHVQLFATPWTVNQHAPLSMGFPRQEYWSGLPFPSPGQYSILTHVYGIWKDGNNNPTCEAAKETQMYRSLLDSVREGEVGMI